jgi:hypothetical protein
MTIFTKEAEQRIIIELLKYSYLKKDITCWSDEDTWHEEHFFRHARGREFSIEVRIDRNEDTGCLKYTLTFDNNGLSDHDNLFRICRQFNINNIG